jgi:hypothetical protein
LTFAKNFGIIALNGSNIKMNQLEVPQEKFALSPEALEITDIYLRTLDIDTTATELGVPREKVVNFLSKKEVKRFINTVFVEQSYANQFKLQGLLDEIIASKLEEAEETGVYTKFDLVELLKLQHKIKMDYLKEIKDLEASAPHNQTNVQVNSYGDNLSGLLEKIVTGGE